MIAVRTMWPSMSRMTIFGDAIISAIFAHFCSEVSTAPSKRRNSRASSSVVERCASVVERCVSFDRPNRPSVESSSCRPTPGSAYRRPSVDSAGTQANGRSEVPVISIHGRYMAFASFATNLVADDSNGQEDVFVHDRGINGER